MTITLQPKEPRQVNSKTNKNSTAASYILIGTNLKRDEKINIQLLLFTYS